jgi:hypothetical protein
MLYSWSIIVRGCGYPTGHAVGEMLEALVLVLRRYRDVGEVVCAAAEEIRQWNVVAGCPGRYSNRGCPTRRGGSTSGHYEPSLTRHRQRLQLALNAIDWKSSSLPRRCIFSLFYHAELRIGPLLITRSRRTTVGYTSHSSNRATSGAATFVVMYQNGFYPPARPALKLRQRHRLR